MTARAILSMIQVPEFREALETCAAYEVRDGGIFTRDYNVRLAEFAANSYQLRSALTKLFDAAHAIVKSEQAANQVIDTLSAPLKRGYQPTRQARLELPLDKKPNKKPKSKKRWRAAWRTAKEPA